MLNRRQIETALEEGGAGPRFYAFALAIDAETYADKIAHESMAIDVARLGSLTPALGVPSGVVFDVERINGKTLLVGGHGAGKSRFVADLVQARAD